MKHYCPISGINWESQHGNFMQEMLHPHPIFAASPTKLLQQRTNWFAGRIENELDRRLLFLALLNSTEQVEFDHPASPSDKVVQTNFPALFKHTEWILRLKVPSLTLPRFRVSKESCDLANVRHWMECWQMEREAFEAGYKRHEDDKKQAERERILERNIKSPSKRAEEYAGLLATWALQAAGAPEEMRRYWRELFLLKAPQLYSANPDHVQELYDFLEAELEPGSIYSHKALWYVQSILKRVKAGWSSVLGIEEEEEATGAIFQIDDDLMRANMLAIVAKAPASRPDRKMYPTEAAYLKALIAWEMREKMLREQQDQQAVKKETTQSLDEHLRGLADGIDTLDDDNYLE